MNDDPRRRVTVTVFLPGLQECLGNQAVVWQKRGDLGKTRSLLVDQEGLCRQLQDPYGLQLALGVLSRSSRPGPSQVLEAVLGR